MYSQGWPHGFHGLLSQPGVATCAENCILPQGQLRLPMLWKGMSPQLGRQTAPLYVIGGSQAPRVLNQFSRHTCYIKGGYLVNAAAFMLFVVDHRTGTLPFHIIVQDEFGVQGVCSFVLVIMYINLKLRTPNTFYTTTYIEGLFCKSQLRKRDGSVCLILYYVIWLLLLLYVLSLFLISCYTGPQFGLGRAALNTV